MAPSPVHCWPRIVLHADLDAFYAAVEQMDDPRLRGKPVIVGPRSRRGVVLTASYEARPFNVGSAMPMAEALRRCPKAIVVPPRFERYEELSAAVMAVFEDFSPTIEAISLDEAFLDMSGATHIFGPPQEMARQVREKVKEATGLTISVGVAASKYVAKVASAVGKPDGLLVVPPSEAQGWLADQSVKRLWGAGPKNVKRLEALGLETIGEVAAADPAWLSAELGAMGRQFFELAHARDPRRVAHRRIAKSLGSDRTLSSDVSRTEDIQQHLKRSADRIGRRLRKKRYLARGVRVRLKTSRFESFTRQCQLDAPSDCSAVLYETACSLLKTFDHDGPFRLVGMAAIELAGVEEPVQFGLFDGSRERALETTLDRVTQRFGDVMVRARDLSPVSATVATSSPNLDRISDQLERLSG